jgi:DNA mismatch repair protein MutS
MKKITESPLLQQHRALKEQYSDCVLLFQVGDFYEALGPDAVLVSQVLDITLTKRQKDLDMAGFPLVSLDQYLPLLARAGHRVAVCNQVGSGGKDGTSEGLLPRVVTQLVTPGVNPDDKALEGHQNNFLAAVYMDQEHYGLALLDVSTGEFYGAEGDATYLMRLLDSFKPAEIIFDRRAEGLYRDLFGKDSYGYGMDPAAFDPTHARERLLTHFQVASLKGFGLDDLPRATIACGAVLQYLIETAHGNLRHITSIQRLTQEGFLWMDAFTIRNLELVIDQKDGHRKDLLSVLDSTVSPMGARLLKRWLLLPLRDLDAINERLDTVEHFAAEGRVRQLVQDHIRACGDLERLTGKIALHKINPRQLVQLGASLEQIGALQTLCNASPHPYLHQLANSLDACPEISERITRELLPEPATSAGKGYLIREGVDPALDELKQLSTTSKHYLEYLRGREGSATGIPSLTLGYHSTYGYYFEAPKGLGGRIPPHWSLKQTLSTADRYSTDELKVFEEKILSADEKIKEMETVLLLALIEALQPIVVRLRKSSQTLALLDCLCSFAASAVHFQYVKPTVTRGRMLDLEASRHPVIERLGPYVTNDLLLDPGVSQVIILTGPNMSGKSALLRQTALITLMAHLGSFVPAARAVIPLTDKIFTRVGASDNLSGGESTFMVEMNETASILNNLTPRSLLLLDEIGRGTATYDGVAIAWSMVEFLHESAERPKTLFATHYHELNDLEKTFPRVKNYHITHEETDGKISFLRKLAPGGSTHSFGLQVARMAGMPPAIIERASLVLAALEDNRLISSAGQNPPG